jgi:hypothetical protein
MSAPTSANATATDVRIDHSDSSVRRRASRRIVDAFLGRDSTVDDDGSLPNRSELLVQLCRALRHDDYKVRWRAVRTCQELIATVPAVRVAIEPHLQQRAVDSVPLVRQAARACLDDDATDLPALSLRYLNE